MIDKKGWNSLSLIFHADPEGMPRRDNVFQYQQRLLSPFWKTFSVGQEWWPQEVAERMEAVTGQVLNREGPGQEDSVIAKARPSVIVPLEEDDIISEEPIDMTLSSRKRALSPSTPYECPPEKKLRPTLTPKLKKKKPFGSMTGNQKRSELIISPEEYSHEGIDNHFKRSLSKYVMPQKTLNLKQTLTEREVDEHFLRSLGWEVWWKIRLQGLSMKQPLVKKRVSFTPLAPLPLKPSALS